MKITLILKRVFLSSVMVVLILLFSACQSDDTTPPTVSISSPASGSPVSDTIAVQINANDDGDVQEVKLYIRAKDSKKKGELVGAATQPPYVVSWFTPKQPNLAELELLAVARDSASNEAESPPVSVRTQNTGVPTFEFLTAFTLVPRSNPSTLTTQNAVQHFFKNTPTKGIVPPNPLGINNLHSSKKVTNNHEVFPQQAQERDLILEWQVAPFTGANGYGFYLSTGDLAGPYELKKRQSATVGTGSQKYSTVIEAAAVRDTFTGVSTAVTSGATAETGFSNADSATFLKPQSALKPENDDNVPNGRPTLTWSQNADAVGYIYYVYDKNPYESNAKLLWSNFPNSISNLVINYPGDRTAFSSGTYYWWVAGISFDNNGKADGFSFSEPRSFKVP